MELAEKGSKDMRQAENVHAIQEGRRNQKQPGGAEDSYPRDRDISCHRCGGKNHSPDACKYKNYKCNHCNLTGHLQKVCRKKLKCSKHTQEEVCSHKSSGSRRGGRVRTILLIFSNTPSPITVTTTVNGAKMPIQVDTGASLSLISEETYHTLWMADSAPTLQESKVKLKTYTGSVIVVKGILEVKVQYKYQNCNLNLVVVKGSGPSLLGRDWLKHIRLDWYQLNSVRVSEDELCENVVSKHARLFDRHLEQYTARFEVDSINSGTQVLQGPTCCLCSQSSGRSRD